MKKMLRPAILLILVGSISFAGYSQETTLNNVSSSQAKPWIANWPSKPREVANKMISQYGAPNEVTNTMLVWYNNGPWKRTILYKEEIPHNFPKPHTDLLQQFVNYKTPLDKYGDLASFDGSVVVERTRGEISARCDKEEMNVLVLNLANDGQPAKKRWRKQELIMQERRWTL